MNKPYSIFYGGLLMASHLTRAGAQAHAFRLAKEKAWDIGKVEIKGGGNNERVTVKLKMSALQGETNIYRCRAPQ